ncbi:MAG: hypothetical protein WC695_10270 [Candidatus Omnitrophota bacterium]
MSGNSSSKTDLLKRFERAIGPVTAGFILDMVDFFSWGPAGIILGLFAGSALGWYLSGVLEVTRKWRIILTWLAGLYCFMPGTEYLPVGTVVGALCRFFQPLPQKNKADDTGKGSGA